MSLQNQDDNHRYDDIISLPHHVSKTRPQMSRINRAAQFSPFAALTGYESTIAETARLTDKRIEADDDTKADIDMRLQILIERAGEKPAVSITYFKPDDKKDGGSYVTISGNVKRVDEYELQVILTNGTKIPINSIYAIEGEIFRFLDNVIE